MTKDEFLAQWDHGRFGDRFWARVDKGAECWLWTGVLSAAGYGVVAIRRAPLPRKSFYAHRISFLLENGFLDDNMLICHSCDNPRCVRPSHLFAGTDDDNRKDSARKGRTCRGESRPLAKLTEHDVRAIRDLYAQGDIKQIELARQFSVDHSIICEIISRKRWSHVY